MDVARDTFVIYSQIFFGGVSFSLSYIMIVFGSVVVFCVCFALVVRSLHHTLRQSRAA